METLGSAWREIATTQMRDAVVRWYVSVSNIFRHRSKRVTSSMALVLYMTER